MSIYSFQENAPTITSTSTTVYSASDAIIIYSQNLGRTAQATLGSAAAIEAVTSATSATTATQIPNYGFTSLGSSSGPATTWLLAPPTVAGLNKTIVNTSTAANIVTSTAAQICTLANTTTVTLTFNVPNALISLVSLSTARWQNLTSTTTANISFS